MSAAERTVETVFRTPAGEVPPVWQDRAVSAARTSASSSWLQDLRRIIRQPRTLAALQRHVAAVFPELEAVDDEVSPDVVSVR